MKSRLSERKFGSLSDRCGIALLYGVAAFLTALVVWLIFMARINIPFEVVWWFTAFIALVGFIFSDGPALKLLQQLWQAIGRSPWPP